MDAFSSDDDLEYAWIKKRDERRASHVTLEKLINKIKPCTSQNTNGSLSTTQDERPCKTKTDGLRRFCTSSNSIIERQNGQVSINAQPSIPKYVPMQLILGACSKQRKPCSCLRRSTKNLHKFLQACAAQRSKRTERHL